MKSHKGFSLIELMVAVAVVGIISVIAIPAYTNYSIRGKIPDATSNLATKRIAMEQSFLDNHVYGGSGAPCVDTATVDTTSSPNNFNFQCTVLTPTTYTMQAQGKNTMAGFTYTIDQSNNKQTTAVPAGWGTAPVSCWVTKPGGIC